MIIKILLSGIFAISLLFQFVNAEVWIPEDEYIGYFDSSGMYNVVGVIKNSEDFPVLPTISVYIKDGEKVISKEFDYINIMPSKEMPFKFKIPEIQNPNPVLENPSISYIRGINQPSSIEVIYDDTLVVHPDGHISGRVINSGNDFVSEVKLLAIIHGSDHQVLDMGISSKPLNLKPGEISNFEMYPDPSISSKVWYYSCFAPSDSTVIPVSTIRNNEKFFFRYDSGAWYAYAEFNEAGTELTMRSQNSFPIETYANFEFPKFSDDEKFTVTLNDEPVNFIQSLDEMGNWHVAFTVEPYSNGNLVIDGFDNQYFWDKSHIPIWVQDRVGAWSTGSINDETFVTTVKFLIDEDFLQIDSNMLDYNDTLKISDWYRNVAGWWANKLISDSEFTGSLKYLFEKEIFFHES